MTIHTLLSEIERGEIVLPAIQRNFVWRQEQITKLLDSIMRSYPVGIALLWETYEDIEYRRFEIDYKQDQPAVFKDNPQSKKLRLVLDGQQRLQSLFLAVKGSYDGKVLFLDVLSGKPQDDVSAPRFLFWFGDKEEGEQWNRDVLVQVARAPDQREEGFSTAYYLRVADLLSMGRQASRELLRKIRAPFGLDDADVDRAELTFDAFQRTLTIDQNILKAAIVDQDLPTQHPERKTLADVLEMFVRVNTDGTKLGNAELIFSMLKLGWKESASALPEFVAEIRKGHSFDLDVDFVIRCLLAVSDLGAKFDLQPLRKRSNVRKIEENFTRCCQAIRATLDFVTRDCHVASVELLSSRNLLVPFVYYFFHLPKHNIPPADLAVARSALFLFAFGGLIKSGSRADARLNKLISWNLRPHFEQGRTDFPLSAVFRWLGEWGGFEALDARLVSNNLHLALHLVQGLANTKVHYVRNVPQLDHIFPAASLRRRGVDEILANDFGNFWLLAELPNNLKRDTDPAEYFAPITEAQLQRALIPRAQLDYAQFDTFVAERREAIVEKVAEQLAIPVGKFPALSTPANA